MITSASNQQIKNISALIKKAKERRNQGCFVVECRKMCLEAPKDRIIATYVSESFAKESPFVSEIKGSYEIVADNIFKSITDTQTPQGILSIVKMPEYSVDSLLDGDRTHLLILDSIQDPGNLGTMLRTGEGAGITGLIMNKTTVDIYNPKTIRSTMGSLYRVPFIIVDDLVDTLSELKEYGVKLYAAHLKGESSYDEQSYQGACGFLIGNEGNGLSDEVAECADTYIRIPMGGEVESLNAAVSAALLMYECSRQRRSGS